MIEMDWKKLAIMFLFIIFLQCGLYFGLGYYHYTHKVTVVENKTFVQYMFNITGKSTEHIKIYDVMVLEKSDEERVRRALMLAPNAYGFNFIEPNESRYYLDTNGVPFPNENETFMVIVAHGENYPNADCAGYTMYNSERVVVLVKESYPDMIIMNMIVHECTHNLEGDENTIDKLYIYESEVNYWGTQQWYFTDRELSGNGMSGMFSLMVIDNYMITNPKY
ncbi:MAG TPA: hypothetical protein PLN36_01205 [Bacteroidales bacterium]|nr:hypothetical protein [Bacteroidales bacterium]